MSSWGKLGVPLSLRLCCECDWFYVRCTSFVNFSFYLVIWFVAGPSFPLSKFLFQTAYLYLEGCFKLMEMFEKSNSGKWKNEAKEKEILEIFRYVILNTLHF